MHNGCHIMRLFIFQVIIKIINKKKILIKKLFSDVPKLTSLAKLSFKICKQEMYEIDTCHECYYNANTKKDWFSEVCSKPHILLWAKLKSFPYWPAKAMVINSAQLVSVRFFGDHDRAWVPVKDCYLYSSKDPNTCIKNKRSNIAESIKEVEFHISKIKSRFGAFNYAALRIPFDPTNLNTQFEMMIPNWDKSTYTLKIEPIDTVTSITKSKLTYKIIKTADNNLSISPVSGGQFRLNGDDSSSSISAYSTPNKNDNNSIIDTSIKSPIKESNSKPNSARSSPNKNNANSKEPSISPKGVSPIHQNTCSNKITIERKNFDGGQKTYQILRRKSSEVNSDSAAKSDDSLNKSDSEKLKRVIIKRKSNNWNMLTIPLKKKNRSSSEESKNSKSENKISDDDVKIVEHKKNVQKRKTSMDEKSIMLKIAKSSTVHVVNSTSAMDTNEISENDEKINKKNDALETKDNPNNEGTTKVTDPEEPNLSNKRLKEKTSNVQKNNELIPKITETLQHTAVLQAPAVMENPKTDDNKRVEQNNTPTIEVDPLLLPDEIKTEPDDIFELETPKEPPVTRVLRSQSKSNEKGQNHVSPTIEKDPKMSVEPTATTITSPKTSLSGAAAQPVDVSNNDCVVIKSEPVSEDEDVVERVFTRASVDKSNLPVFNAPSRGFVTVRDINKMKNITTTTLQKIPISLTTMQNLNNNKKKGEFFCEYCNF